MSNAMNVVIVSLDEVRPDHIGCYGYGAISTPGHDRIAKEGVRFETCISSADFTPVAMASAITGKYPDKHGMREPYQQLVAPSIASILKRHGYRTAGFVGNGLLSAKHGYAKGFDFWDEPTEEACVAAVRYGVHKGVVHYDGNYWVESFFSWLKANHGAPFFMWGHFFETHEGSEESLLHLGFLDEDDCSDFGYYDAKIEMADERLVQRLLSTLDELKIADRTVLVVMSDHGTNLGEHPGEPIPWRGGEKIYPQHTTMYDHDLKVSMLVRAPGLPRGKTVHGMVRSVDLVPSLLGLLRIGMEGESFDGESWLGGVASGTIEGRTVYSEDVFEPRGPGAIQSLRTDSAKFIRNLTQGTEEYYDLQKDPAEQKNIVGAVDPKMLVGMRKELNRHLLSGTATSTPFSDTEKQAIASRLRALGYVE